MHKKSPIMHRAIKKPYTPNPTVDYQRLYQLCALFCSLGYRYVLFWGLTRLFNGFFDKLCSKVLADNNCNKYYRKADTVAADLLAKYGANAVAVDDLTAVPTGEGRLVLAEAVTDADVAALRGFAEAGGKVMLLGQKALPETLLTETEAVFKEHRQEILTMNMPESTVFDGIDTIHHGLVGGEHAVGAIIVFFLAEISHRQIGQ